ncbi:MAG: VacB/RNase II family 3'-5' exoribonuclease [Simkaniaceae bacterium]|nr:VacB/RNase II family 3'-5' exoribonuclease [Simkaniaceae bacterium]
MKFKKKSFKSLYREILKIIQDKNYSPLSFDQLSKRLKLSKKDHPFAHEALDQLIAEQHIVFKKGLFHLSESNSPAQLVEGKVSVHPRGFAFVSVEGEERDIFIPKPFTHGAVDKDIVEVAVDPKVSSKGPEGKITRILERARANLMCVIEDKFDDHSYYAFSPTLGIEKEIIVSVKKPQTLKRGDRIVVKVKHWGDEKSPTRGELKKVMGSITTPSIDVECATIDFQLPDTFPKAVIKEAKAKGITPQFTPDQQRKDLTDWVSFTIDPATAKDFDDALSIEKDSKGNYRLAVHIADVSHYVTPGSNLDDEAYHRGNSTYFPGTCLPMLPEEISNELCSLKENVIRFTVSVIMDVQPDGSLKSYEIIRSAIKSRKRFTYEEAKEVLDGKIKHPLLPELNLLLELCLKFKGLRRLRGSVDLSMPEIRLDINAAGKPTGFHRVEYDITHQMVEECMLKANELVATHLKMRKVPSIFRIHEAPSLEQFKDFHHLAQILGFKLPSEPTPFDLQKLFDEAKDSPLVYQLSTAYIRSMKLAIYSPENVGHYGLALENYTHFTSPIRRYSDLVIHRLLFEPDYKPNLQSIANHCSETERVSFRAEMQVLQLKKLRLLKEMHKKNPKAKYNAIVTKVKPNGIAFELENLLTDGFIHISNLSNDYLIYDQSLHRLVGSHSKQQFYTSKKIQLEIASIDLILLEIIWEVCKEK